MRIKALDCIADLAEKDDRICFIGSDLGQGTLASCFLKNILIDFLWRE